ncbi:Z1 domain-containing protein [Paracoccus yeei]|uniref:Beta-1,4-mannanase n=1 Tax=Paracoccus yeei TaxID=147645 RepID=A0A2D2BXN1_9RHOB|nr:Z1 domain-containing protein [Paracoccus yeei]ATQ55025.1 beta-1,4-mannanase [Paracoccus yeei]
MPGPQVDGLVERIRQALPRHGDLESAVAAVRAEIDLLSPGLADSLSAEIDEAASIVASEFGQIEILHSHSVIRKRPKWYFGSRPSDLHWPAVKGFLLNDKKWHEDDVRGIDDASNEVVSLLENPRDPGKSQFSCRGLVVGHVQSGKTANMTAVIAKGLDAGYDTVIVLAGLTNKLRHQTQLRLYSDLVRRNPLNWQVLTSNEVDRDFRAPPQGGFLSHSDKAQLAVVKKNVSPLGQLRKAINETLPAVLRQLRVLVIDDECDQATVNSARGELDMTAINERIRELLSMLPAATYVGYTATPFANVLINPYRRDTLKEDAKKGRLDTREIDDLYPRDFISALPKPERYFGTERLFGKTPVNPEDIQPDEEGLDMIRNVPEEDEAVLQPRSRQERDAFQPAMTSSLETAILYFLGCCAARRARGQDDQHMTMLVHTSAYVRAHERVAALIEGWVDVHRRDLVDPASEIGSRLGQVWVEEQGRLPDDLTDAPPVTIEEIFDHLPEVLQCIEFPVENGASDDRIDYSGKARTYIVVGGSILARGLTLEGLMVSYFLRTANQYDTLLQMGRWFGYRRGYEDLPRIWMPRDLKLRFRALAAVEQEIRDDIEQYRLRDLTPMDLAVRIKAIPGMAITAANKMRAARRSAVSYWGTHRQTFRFAHRDALLLEKNWGAGSELISRIETLGLRDLDARERRLWRNVPKSSIRRFLESYSVEPSHADLLPAMLLPFIDEADQRLLTWNVGIIESGRGRDSESPLGTIGSVRTVNRAKLKDANGIADIKALMSRRDVLFDCSEQVGGNGSWEELKAARLDAVGHVPLLLLYPIARESRPERESKAREPLDAVHDVLGIGIVFPGSITEGGNFVSVDLQPLSAEELAAIEEEEAAQAEAAGV